MNKQDKEKALEILLNFKNRAEKLSKKSEEWEVNSNLDKIMKKMGVPLEIVGGGNLSKKGRVKLVQSIQNRLLVLKNHFASVYRMVQKNPIIWDKKIENNERKLGKRISFYEKMTPILFRKIKSEK